MSPCKRCGGKGYIESWYHHGNRASPSLSQCCDITAYSRRVQLLHQTREDAFKAIGKEEPFIGKQMNVTGKKGLEIKKGASLPTKGEPCPIIPLIRKS